MPAYLVTLDLTKSGYTTKERATAMVVFAADATTALQMASAHFDGDGQQWVTNGTATAIVAASNWIGWTFRITLVEVGGAAVRQVSLTSSGASNDTIDEIGAALVVLLNAVSGIANAAYNSTTNVLTVAGAADGLGDHRLLVEIIPPGKSEAIAALVGTVVDEGSAGDAVTVALPADAAVIPSVPVPLAQ